MMPAEPILDDNVGVLVVCLIAWCRERLTVDEQRAVHLALADSCPVGEPRDGCLCHERGWQAAEAQRQHGRLTCWSVDSI